MNGKILKISSNDLYGNVDDREVVVFAAFNHTKYMNKYIIFSFKDEYNKNKLYYGSVHLKDNSLVIFAISNNNTPYIDKFITDYLNNTIDNNEYEIIDISKYEKVEIVSYNDKDFDKLDDLDKISIARENEEDTVKTSKKPVFLYIILLILIIFLAGITYLYLNPDAFTVELKTLNCTKEDYNNKVELKYTIERTIKFNKDDKVDEINVIESYQFLDEESYIDFKSNNKQAKYFNIKGTYKYSDEDMKLKLIYNDTSIIENYDEMKTYLNREGYTCKEETYYE